MDHRLPLKLHSILPLGDMDCHIDSIVGMGSNAIVYKAWYFDRLNEDKRHHVLIKELFPFDPRQQIWRDESGAIVVETEAESLWLSHKESFEAGNRAHLSLLEAQPELMALGANINSFTLNNSLYSVLGYTGGRSMQEDINKSAPSLRSTVRRLLSLLDGLEAFHQSAYLHLDISPDNIMLVGQKENERIFLIDYNSSIKLGENKRTFFSCKPGFSAPELSYGDTGALSPATDLYSVAAVFYRCLMGRKLSLMDALRPMAPDGKESPLLEGQPQTVSAMVSAILKKGLDIVPTRRYQSIAQLRLDLTELLDRIDCVGVTHWALWETGRRGLNELISQNPSLRYLKEDKRLYPMRLEIDGDASMALTDWLEGFASSEGRSGILLGQGGMGKTSALLHAGTLLSRRYSPASPAVFYLPVSSWNGSETNYIENRILMSLRFKRHENNYADALHALRQLLSQPLKTKNGERPALILLLDGLNETAHDSAALLREINELSAMAGVRILAASRTAPAGLELEKLQLMPLNVEDVEKALGERGLLVPTSHQLLSLMRTPLMLSLYIEAALAGTLSDIEGEEGLMGAYMEALLKKATGELPEDSPELWQLDAALNLVLPAIAARAKRQGGALSEPELLKTVRDCYRALRRPYMRGLFPRWIGRSGEILGGADSAEDWYGLMVNSILWQRLGMLVRYEGGYRIFHQSLEDYLAKKHQPLSRARRRNQGLALLSAAAMLSLIIWLCWPKSYDAVAVDKAMEETAATLSSYYTSVRPLNAQLSALLYGDTDYFIEDYEMIAEKMGEAKNMMPELESCREALDAMLSSGHMMPYSKQSFDGAKAMSLVETVQDAQTLYLEYLPLVRAWADSTAARTSVPDFPMCLKNMMEADGLLVGKLYYECLYPHIENADGDSADSAWLQRLDALVYSGDIFVLEGGELSELMERQENARQDFLISAVSTLQVLEDTGIEPPISPSILSPISAENAELRAQAVEDISACLEYYDTLISRTLWALDYVDDFVRHNSWESLLKARAACAAAAESYLPDELPLPGLPEDDFRLLLEDCLAYELALTEDAEDYIDTAALAYERSYYHYSDYDVFSMGLFIQLLECDVYRSATLPILENASRECRASLERLSRELCARTNSLLYALGDQRLWYELPSSFPNVAEGMGRWVSDPLQLADAENTLYSEYYIYQDKQIDLVNLWSIASSERQKFMADLEDGRTDEAATYLNHIFGAPDCVPAPPWLWERLLPGSTMLYDQVLDMYDYEGELSFLPIYYDGNNRYHTGQLIHAAPEGLVFSVVGVEYDEILAYEKTLERLGYEVVEKEHLLDWEYCRRVSRGDFLMEISWSEYGCVIDISSSCCFVPEACLELFTAD